MDSHEANTNTAFAMTCPRLNLFSCVTVLLLYAIFIVCLPKIWNNVETLNIDSTYRQPFHLSEDYDLYRRRVRDAVDNSQIILIGDSVIWGEYVAPGESLNDYLNRESNSNRFVNGGLNGLHPLAMEGLIEHYADDLFGNSVLLHLNLLWMSSAERDLSDRKKHNFNHSKLVRQFSTSWPFVNSEIPAYQDSMTKRVGIVVNREFEVRDIVQHIRLSNFDGQDLHSWSLKHPYKNPLENLTLKVPNPKKNSTPQTSHMDGKQYSTACIRMASSRSFFTMVGFPTNGHKIERKRDKSFCAGRPFQHALDCQREPG